MTAAFWKWIFHPSNGFANWIIGLFGMTPIMWLGYRYYSVVAVVISLLSANIGFYALIILSSINSIPKAVIEAAQMDGASNRQINYRIILPIVMESVVFILSLTIIGALGIWEAIYVMRPVAEAYSFSFDVYATGYIEGRYGLSFAKNIILVVIILAIVYATRRARRGLSYSES
jgi:ABC-type sugar transport system permease subunit